MNIFASHPARIIDIVQETALEWTFRFESHDTPSFGQFYQVSIPGRGEAPISVSGRGSGYIEMTVRNVGRLTGALFEKTIGDAVFMRGPYGNPFPLEKFANEPLIIAAGGSGVAPVRTLINHLYDHPGTVPRLDLLVGFRNPAAVLFKREIDKWQDRFPVTVTVDEGAPGWNGRVGLITKLIPDLSINDPEAVNAVIVGPPIMMKFTVMEFFNRHLPESRIWLSFERHMSCGVGKCGHCKIDDVYVCVDGPVFPYSKARHLID